MKPDQILRAIAAVAGLVLVMTIVVIAVDFLGGLVGVLSLSSVVVVALASARVLRRHIPKGTALEIDFDGGVVEQVGNDPLSRAASRNAATLRDVVDALTRAAADDRITGLVARVGNGGIQLGHAQELRDAVHGLRDAGKATVAFSESFGETGLATVDYYLACAFEEIHLQPVGIASVQGVLAKGRFVRGVLDKLGITPDLDHRKEYKSAKYMLTETRFTAPHREATGSLAGDQFAQIVEGIAADRRMAADRVRDLIDGAPFLGTEAQEAGLVDRLGYRDEAYEAVRAGRAGFIRHDRYLKRAGRPHRRGGRIGLIYGTGPIKRGSSGFDPLTRGSALGADDVARAFRIAVEDRKVRAIVFRVDSPGGSAVGSEVVRREVVRAKEKGKPVVVSMGNVAGSGGYWVSADADHILAQPGTITGSIGVVTGKLATREAWAKLGVTFDQILFGENSTFSSSHDMYSDGERERLTAFLDAVYEDFTELVASSRELSIEHVEEIAKGRIWSGAQALEIGLVDELGGLEDAIAAAKERAGIEAGIPVDVRVYPKRKTLPLPGRKESSEPIQQLAMAFLEMLDGARAVTGGIQLRIPGY